MHTRRSAPKTSAMLLGILCWLTAGSMTAGAADFVDCNADRNTMAHLIVGGLLASPLPA